MVIRGEIVPRPTKEAIVVAIADRLGLPRPDVSKGSSVDSQFLDGIYTSLFGGPSGGSDTYRKTERLLERLGRTYDPYWDTSESHGQTGGGTVTVRAYSQIRSAITGIDRCYLVPMPRFVEADPRRLLSLAGLRGTKAFIEGGPGSRIIYYRRDAEGHIRLTATATVRYIRDGWDGPWTVDLVAFNPLDTPVSERDLNIPGWDPRNAITEITPATFDAIGATGGASSETVAESPEHGIRAEDETPADDAAAATDPAGDAIAERVLRDFPASEVSPFVSIPSRLPEGTLVAGPARTPQYEEANDAVQAVDVDAAPTKSRNPRRDRLAEKRAVDLTIEAFERQGWALSRDRQKDGVGYDLEFTKDARTLHVEVKGIQGPRLAFNLTPKELWRAETDEAWILVAATSVLSPKEFKLHTVMRDRIVNASRAITGYRVTM